MGLRRAVMIAAAFATMIGLGCDGTTTAIGGVYDVGRVDFHFGGGQFWRLNQVELIVDTGRRTVEFSGFSTDGALWIWAGSYTRSGNRIAATDLPEIDFGSDDLLDLHLEFSQNRFEGAAINWEYVGRDLVNIGAARIDGRRVARTIPRSAPTEDGEKRQPKYDDPDLL